MNIFNEINGVTSPLAELSKKYDCLPDRELNKSLDISRSLDNFLEGILPNKEEGLRRDAEVEEELEKKLKEIKNKKKKKPQHKSEEE